LEQSQEAEEERLRQELERIEHQLSRREDLREQAVDDLRSKLDWYLERLELVYRRPGSQKEKQERLKQQVQELYRQIRMEKRSAWKDVQELEREHRRLHSELSELEDTDIVSELFDDIDNFDFDI
jgi:predicted phage-related endonuclease